MAVLFSFLRVPQEFSIAFCSGAFSVPWSCACHDCRGASLVDGTIGFSTCLVLPHYTAIRLFMAGAPSGTETVSEPAVLSDSRFGCPLPLSTTVEVRRAMNGRLFLTPWLWR